MQVNAVENMKTYEENGCTFFCDRLEIEDVILQHIALLNQAAGEKKLLLCKLYEI